MSATLYQHVQSESCNMRQCLPEVTSFSGSCREWRVVNIIVVKLGFQFQSKVRVWTRDLAISSPRNGRLRHQLVDIHKHSKIRPTTVSNSPFPISPIPLIPSPSTSMRSSCGRFISSALPTVVASVWPTTSSFPLVPPSTVVAVRWVIGSSSLCVSWLWNMPGFIGSVEVVASGTWTQ
jgi:hypothetical protein